MIPRPIARSRCQLYGVVEFTDAFLCLYRVLRSAQGRRYSRAYVSEQVITGFRMVESITQRIASFVAVGQSAATWRLKLTSPSLRDANRPCRTRDGDVNFASSYSCGEFFTGRRGFEIKNSSCCSPSRVFLLAILPGHES